MVGFYVEHIVIPIRVSENHSHTCVSKCLRRRQLVLLCHLPVCFRELLFFAISCLPHTICKGPFLWRLESCELCKQTSWLFAPSSVVKKCKAIKKKQVRHGLVFWTCATHIFSHPANSLVMIHPLSEALLTALSWAPSTYSGLCPVRPFKDCR